jgi:hypothetical protein
VESANPARFVREDGSADAPRQANARKNPEKDHAAIIGRHSAGGSTRAAFRRRAALRPWRRFGTGAGTAID